MERQQVLVVDAFADEPMGGRQVAVLPEAAGLSGAQCRAVAEELGTAGTVHEDDGELVYVPSDAGETTIEGALAGYTALAERGTIDAGSLAVRTDEGTRRVEVTETGTPWVDAPPMDVAESSVSEEEVASALGIDVASIQDIGADLPVGQASGGGGSLLVPVNFLEHLGRIEPETQSLSGLLEAASLRRVVAFTFDTLTAESDIHARVFDPAAPGGEHPTGAVGIAACGPHLTAHSVFDGERTELHAECGHFLDRPATVTATLEGQPQVTGPAVTTLEGTVSLPADESDDIVEV